MIEYSRAYVEGQRRRLAELEAGLSPELLAVIRELSEDFKHSCTKVRVVEKP